MTGRLRKSEIVLAIFGLVFTAGGAFDHLGDQEGYRSLDAFSAAQDVRLTYNDRASSPTAARPKAQAIKAMLANDWGYPVITGDLNPNDPVVNTACEYMYQMATVAYHTLDGTQTVVLPKTFTAHDGTVYNAGTVPGARRRPLWSAFDAPTRSTPTSVHRPGPAWPTP